MSRKQKYVVIGMGAFGKEIARTMQKHDADIIVMDKSENVVSSLKQEGFDFAVQIDTTDSSSLARFIKPDDIVILAMGESFEGNILTVGILKELGVSNIYARATTDIQIKILDRMGIKESLFPEKQEGKRFALHLLFKDFKFLDEFTSDVFIVEVKVPPTFYGKTIIDMNVRNQFNVNIVGLKDRFTDKNGVIKETMISLRFENIVLRESHTFVVIGHEEDIIKLTES